MLHTARYSWVVLCVLAAACADKDAAPCDCSSPDCLDSRCTCSNWQPLDQFTALDTWSTLHVQPRAAAQPDGSLWLTFIASGTDNLDIFLARLSKEGAITWGPTQVNEFTAGVQNEPRLAMRADGGGVVCFGSSDNDGNNQSFARPFAADGTFGAEHEITIDGKSVWQAACAVHDNGYVAVGMRPNDAGTNWELWLTKLDASAAPVGAGVRLDELNDGGTPSRPEIVVNGPASTIGVTWQRYFIDKASLRFADSNLGVLASEIDLGEVMQGDIPSITRLGDGFLVTSTGHGTGAYFDVLGRTYDAAGVAGGSPVQLNDAWNELRAFPAASCFDAAHCAIIWVTVDGTSLHGYRRWVDFDRGILGPEEPLSSALFRPYAPGVVATECGAWAFWVGSPNVIRGTSFAN